MDKSQSFNRRQLLLRGSIFLAVLLIGLTYLEQRPVQDAPRVKIDTSSRLAI